MKKLLSIILVLAVCAAAFAQAAGGSKNVQKYLSASDVDALVKNFKPLGEELDTFEDLDDMVGLDAFMSPDFDSLNFLSSLKSTPKLDAVFVKYGMGKDGIRKLYVIIWAFEVTAFDRIIAVNDASGNGIELRGLQPAMDSLKSCINPADLNLVSSRWDDLILIFGDPTANEATEVSSDEQSDEVMTVDDFYGEDSGEYDDSEYDDSGESDYEYEYDEDYDEDAAYDD